MRKLILAALAAGGLANGAIAAETACDTKLMELTQKMTQVFIEGDEKNQYMSRLVGAYQRCNAGEAGAWTQTEAYLANK